MTRAEMIPNPDDITECDLWSKVWCDAWGRGESKYGRSYYAREAVLKARAEKGAYGRDLSHTTDH